MESEVEQISAVFTDRARAEVNLLAALTDSPYRSILVLKECGVSPGHFQEADTQAIFVAIEDAAINRWTKQQMFEKASAFLRALRLWQHDDLRSYVCGSVWGPGPLATLICRTPFNEGLIVHRCARLLSLVEAQEKMQ